MLEAHPEVGRDRADPTSTIPIGCSSTARRSRLLRLVRQRQGDPPRVSSSTFSSATSPPDGPSPEDSSSRADFALRLLKRPRPMKHPLELIGRRIEDHDCAVAGTSDQAFAGSRPCRPANRTVARRKPRSRITPLRGPGPDVDPTASVAPGAEAPLQRLARLLPEPTERTHTDEPDRTGAQRTATNGANASSCVHGRGEECVNEFECGSAVPHGSGAGTKLELAPT